MSELGDEHVHRGFWINLSQGSVLGGTLTVDSRTGNIVVAILSICATIATAKFWQLLAFLIHQWRAKGNPSDGLYWQQQALLRTLPSSTALIADAMKLGWSWRQRAERPVWNLGTVYNCCMLHGCSPSRNHFQFLRSLHFKP